MANGGVDELGTALQKDGWQVRAVRWAEQDPEQVGRLEECLKTG